MKIALCLICRPTEDEGKLLANAISSASEAVDGIFVTQAGEKPNEYVSGIIKMFNGHDSFYKWDNNFANARNFNFSQVPKDFDYILWLDADDVIKGADKLRKTVEENQAVDLFSLWYNYAFDEWGNPIVVHHKTRIIRNDGCVEWAGALHEDFKHNRQITAKHVEGIEVLHMTNGDRIEESKDRNVTVSEQMVKDLPSDPRSYWNLGNSYKAAGKNTEALEQFDTFLEMSQSDDEKYIVRLRRAESLVCLGEQDKAVDELRYAIGMKPDYPDAYIHLGQVLYEQGKYADAIGLLKQSLSLEPPKYKIIVFNPMDYGYTPLKWLAYSYMAIDQPMLAYECFKLMLDVTPEDKKLKEIVDLVGKKAKKYEKMLSKYNEIKDMDLMGMKVALANLPKDFQNAPMFVNLRNKHFPKTKSSGKEVVFMCGYTEREWTPDSLKEGIGGSEEAVIYLSRELAKSGFEVTVYNNCGHETRIYDGVTYKPFYTFNYRDKTDTVILWRHPKLADYDINCSKLILDLHDVISPGELNQKRLEKIDKIFVKSQFHRSLFPDVPDDKFVVIQNGIDWQSLQVKTKRDSNLIINTSSPDRSLSSFIRCFKHIKEQVPEAKAKWAYGWGVFDVVHGDNKKIMQWKEEQIKGMEEAGIENLDRISHKEIAKLNNEAGIFLYPTEFAEIDCISARKAQACGAYVITTDFSALDETVEFGTKIHSGKNKDNWCAQGQFDFSAESLEDQFVEETVKALKRTNKEKREEMKKFDWANIAKTWKENF